MPDAGFRPLQPGDLYDIPEKGWKGRRYLADPPLRSLRQTYGEETTIELVEAFDRRFLQKTEIEDDPYVDGHALFGPITMIPRCEYEKRPLNGDPLMLSGFYEDQKRRIAHARQREQVTASQLEAMTFQKAHCAGELRKACTRIQKRYHRLTERIDGGICFYSGQPNFGQLEQRRRYARCPRCQCAVYVRVDGKFMRHGHTGDWRSRHYFEDQRNLRMIIQCLLDDIPRNRYGHRVF